MERDRENELVRLLTAFDAELAAGDTAARQNTEIDGDAELSDRLEDVQACLRLFEKHWPRRKVTASELEPATFGRYVIVREIGRGGFGVVYLAEDPQLGRDVALKVQRPETVLSADLRARFLREAHMAALVSHPNIVPVFDSGEENWRCWMAAEYCRGPSLAQYLAERTQPVAVAEASRLLACLADAIAYAHTRGVLHRDLKPSNVLLSSRHAPSAVAAATESSTAASTDEYEDGGSIFPSSCLSTVSPSPADGTRSVPATLGNVMTQRVPSVTTTLDDYVPKLTDFGLAKLLETGEDMTRSGGMLGTPSYMAPEQIESRKGKIGPWTDVYGLGAILYELLTGRPPVQGGFDATTCQRLLLEDPPPPRRLRPDVPRDLEAITLKCLEKSPAQRYQSATELVADLRRFLSGEPTQARPLGVWQRLAKWSRREPAIALLVLTAIVAPTIFGMVQWRNSKALSVAVVRANEKESEATRERLRAEDRERVAKEQLYTMRIKSAYDAFQSGNVPTMRSILAPYQELPPDQRPKNFEYRYLWKLTKPEKVSIDDHEGEVYSVAYSRDGKWLASAGQDGIRLRDPQSGKCLHHLRGHLADVNQIDFSSDSRLLVSASDDHTVRLWNVAEHREQQKLDEHQAFVVCAMFSPTGKYFATADHDGWLKIWTTEGELVTSHRQHTGRIGNMAFAGDGSLLFTVSSDGFLKSWDMIAQKPAREAKPSDGGAIAVACDAKTDDVYTGSGIGQIVLWNGRTLERYSTLGLEGPPIQSLAHRNTPNPGGILACGQSSGTVFEVPGFRSQSWPLVSHRSHTRTVFCVAYAPDGQTLASVSADHGVRLWRSNHSVEQTVKLLDIHSHQIVSLFPDGQRVAGCFHDGVRIYDQVADTELLLPISSTQGPFVKPAISGDSSILATGAGKKIWFFKTASGDLLQQVELKSDVKSIKFSGDGKVAAMVESSGVVECWDWEVSKYRRVDLSPHGRFAELSHDGKSLALISEDGQFLELRDVERRCELLARWQGDKPWHDSICFSVDGARLAAVGQDRRIYVFDTHTRTLLQKLPQLHQQGGVVAFGHEGKSIISVANEVVEFWHIELGIPYLKIGVSMPRDVCLSNGGHKLSALCDPGGGENLRFWQLNAADD